MLERQFLELAKVHFRIVDFHFSQKHKQCRAIGGSNPSAELAPWDAIPDDGAE